MVYQLELRKRAGVQMQSSYDYYENKSLGLGEKFLLKVEEYFEL